MHRLCLRYDTFSTGNSILISIFEYGENDIHVAVFCSCSGKNTSEKKIIETSPLLVIMGTRIVRGRVSGVSCAWGSPFFVVRRYGLAVFVPRHGRLRVSLGRVAFHEGRVAGRRAHVFGRRSEVLFQICNSETGRRRRGEFRRKFFGGPTALTSPPRDRARTAGVSRT